MKIDYKIQCPRCARVFDVGVEPQRGKTLYPTNCPRCKKKIKIKLVPELPDHAEPGRTREFQDLKMSLFSSRQTAPASMSAECEPGDDDEEIVFKCVQRTTERPSEKQSRVIKPKESKGSKTRTGILKPRGAPDKSDVKEKKDIKTSVKSIDWSKLKDKPAKKHDKAPEKVQDDRCSEDEYEYEPQSKNYNYTDGLEVSRITPMVCIEPYKPPEPTPVEPISPKSRSRRRGRKRRRAWEEDYYQDTYEPSPPPKPKKPGYFSKPENRLKIASWLLVLVFALGLTHGLITLAWGNPEHIEKGTTGVDTVDIDGAVIDFKTGKPISNCRIRILGTDQVDYTNQDGYYYIPGVQVGDTKIEAQITGYAKVVKEVSVVSEQPSSFNFELKEGVNSVVIDETVKTVEKSESPINGFAVLLILLSISAVAALVLIRSRNMFRVCALFTFLSILSIGLGLGFVLGLVALILILMSGSEFRKLEEKGE
jgi:hypothetical protein